MTSVHVIPPGLLVVQGGGLAWHAQCESAAQTQKSLPGYGHSAPASDLQELPVVGLVAGHSGVPLP